jgi:hypothetical protein
VNVVVKTPFVKLTYEVEKILGFLKYIHARTKEEDLEVALEALWSMSRILTEEERDCLTTVQTIVNAQKDGQVEPKEFDVFELYRKVVS